MDVTQGLIGLAAAWLLTGLVLGYVMRKRGHNFALWFTFGSLLGPLAVPLAFENVRREAELAVGRDALTRTTGDRDVLVALDGSQEAAEAFQAAASVLTGEPTSFTFVTVLDYEARSPLASDEQERTQQMLDEVSRSISGTNTATEILYGEPSKVLLEYASETGKDLVVIGTRGRGASERLFGSVARAIVSDSDVPVLVGPRPGSRRARSR